MMSGLLVLVSMSWAQEPTCPADARGAVVALAGQVEQAWYDVDEPTFATARQELDRALACVEAPLEVADAVALHRARAITAYVDGETEAARRAFAALRTLQPSWTPPADKVPPEHPLWRLWMTALSPDTPQRSLAVVTPPAHGWGVDGTRYEPAPDADTPQPGLPMDRAFVLQVYDADRHASYTGYHLSVHDVPVDQLALAEEQRRALTARRRQAHVWGSVVGGALLAGAATTFALGWDERQSLTRGEAELADAEAVAARANTLGGVSYGLAGAGALSLTVAWSVKW